MKRHNMGGYIVLIAMLFVACTDTLTAAPVEFSANYQADGMSSVRDINGYEPSEAGNYPVYVWITGTWMDFWNGDDEIFTQRMAECGFVAVSVEYYNGWGDYPNGYPDSCSELLEKVDQIFDISDPCSAINTICSRPNADCSKGIVVSGFSQGANIASLAKNYDGRVEAAFLIGNGYTGAVYSCLQDSATVITSDRIRSIVGASDTAFGASPPDGVRTQQEVTTGISCGTGAFDCIQPDGSGWYMVQTSDTSDGEDDHCFMYTGTYCGGTFDTNFEHGTDKWSLDPSLDWLASFVSCPSSDFDDDCKVNINDLLIFAQAWLSSDPQADIAPAPSGNGIVDYADFGILAQDWAFDKNLRGYWKFDGDTTDSSFYNRAIVVVGDPNLIANGHIGGAIDLNGNDVVRADNYYGVNNTQSRTVAAWINTSQTGQIVSWGEFEVAGGRWEFLVDADGYISVNVGDAVVSGSTDLRDSTWHHVAAVLDSDGSPNVNEILLYVDGTQEAVPSDSQTINTNRLVRFKIGVFVQAPVYFNGLIDDVRIYDRVLSQAEITALAAM